MDYGKTLHLPETEFPMRGNLPKREPELLAFWKDNDIYHKRLKKREGAKKQDSAGILYQVCTRVGYARVTD